MAFNFGSATPINPSPFGATPATPAFGAGLTTSTPTAAPSFSFPTQSVNQQQQNQASKPAFSFSSTQQTKTGFGQSTNMSSSLLKPSTPAPILGTATTFGSTTPQQQQSGRTGTGSAQSVFSTSANKPSFGTDGKLFGGFGSTPATATSTTTGLFGASQQLQQQPLSQQCQPGNPTILDKLEALRQRWDLKSPNCQFQHYFYNYIHPSERYAYARPPNHDENLWNLAMKDNPNPECFVPALAVGFDDLKKRMEQQEQQSMIHKAKLQEISEKVAALQQAHDLSTRPKLLSFKLTHLTLSHRVLKLMKQIQLLRSHNLPGRSEEQLRAKLESLLLQLKKPGLFRGRVQELWAMLQMAKENGTLGNGADDEAAWEAVDEEGLALIFKVLSDQTTGLSHLTDILQTDQENVSRIEREANQLISSMRPNIQLSSSSSRNFGRTVAGISGGVNGYGIGGGGKPLGQSIGVGVASGNLNSLSFSRGSGVSSF